MSISPEKLPTTLTMRRKLEALKTEPLGSKDKPRTSVSTRMAPTELLHRQQRQAQQPSLLLVLPLLLHLSHIHISSSPFVANSQGVNHSPVTYASTVFPLDTGKPTAPKTSHKVNDKYTVPDRRIDDAICCLQKTITHFPDVTARELARVVGKIISMTPVMDIFKVGRWTGTNCGLQDHRLAELESELPRYCVTSKAFAFSKTVQRLEAFRAKMFEWDIFGEDSAAWESRDPADEIHDIGEGSNEAKDESRQ
ncbi:uncharacterized protein LOC134231259, partial [Saccostrea cucullata]|uniref:uncharacterized protein LOC134231259 n=1 Tax=Saccostrea cuccullata TaxID=36930 RepID=UPI002ED0C5D4